MQWIFPIISGTYLNYFLKWCVEVITWSSVSVIVVAAAVASVAPAMIRIHRRKYNLCKYVWWLQSATDDMTSATQLCSIHSPYPPQNKVRGVNLP